LYVDWRQGLFIHPSANRFVQLCEYKADTPMRNNQKNYQKQNIFSENPEKIETLFSQLCDQFKIRNNYAKSFNGFKTRVLSKITALTFIQFVNVFVFSRKMNRLKIELI
jgi:hypothetical protein